MIIKPKIIRFLNPIRRLHNGVYSFILAAYLGKIIIILNQIDHNILDLIFYFFVYDPRGKDIKEFYKVISSQTMGTKLKWLKEIYNGKTSIIKTKTTLKTTTTVNFLAGNKTLEIMIDLFGELITDTRNPLVHSNYFLGYGNEHEWKLSYHRFHFNKIKDDFDNSPFGIKEAKKYLQTVQQSNKKLMRLYFQLFNDAFPV